MGKLHGICMLLSNNIIKKSQHACFHVFCPFSTHFSPYAFGLLKYISSSNELSIELSKHNLME